MRWAAPASLGLHLGLLAAAWLALQWEPADASTAESAISIEIISVEDAASEPSEAVSESSMTLVAAGTTLAEPVPAEVAEAAPIEPIELATSELIPPAVNEPTPTQIDTAEPVHDAAVPPDTTSTDEPAAVEEAAPEIADPVDVAELQPSLEGESPPVPNPRLVREAPSAEPERTSKPVEKPKKQPAKQKEKTAKKKVPQVASIGSGGEDAVDSAASKAGGSSGKALGSGKGDAEAYPGKVFSQLSRAVRRPRGNFDGGEVRIMFTLNARGRVIKSALARSSGDPAVDEAAFSALSRASFPPIPEGAGKSTWSFTFPLLIK